MKKGIQYTISVARSGKCIKTMKIWYSFCLSTVTKLLKQLKSLLTKKGSISRTALPNGLWKSKREAIREAKMKMYRFGGRWGVVKLGEFYCEVEESYFRLHHVKPIWIKRDWKWLTGQ